jgi:uncharacterized membrane protein YuzA (DUF378 family)
MKNQNTLDIISIILLVIGGLNWGIIGLFDRDVIDAIFGMTVARGIFIAVGLAAVYRLCLWIGYRTR